MLKFQTYKFMNLSNLMLRDSRKKLSRLLCITALSACSVFAYAQQQPVHLTGNNLPLKSVFKQLEKQTELSIDYKSQDIDDSRIIKQMPKASTIQQAMEQLLNGTDCIAIFSNGHIIIKKKDTQEKNKPTKKVKGTILDAAGIPVIGANIMVKGTAQGTITDLNGQFSLDVPAGTTLQISYIGMANQEVKVGNQTNLSITMKEDSEMLDELVVVGFGTQKKVNLTGAVTAVAGDDLTKRPVLNAENMLQGQVPGLSVIQKSGQPGSDNTSFRIRGQGTYSDAGSDPLVLVNGVPGSLSSLDPSIIESVSVLKDASSASIYGSRAANGVILVTTKKGADGKKFSATYSGNFSVYSPTKMLDMVTNSAEYMELYNIAKTNSQLGGLYDETEIGKYRNSNGSLEFPSFDWVDYMFNPAFVQNHNLSLCGSSEKTDYNITLNLADQPGTMRGFNYNKYNFSLNLNSQLTKWLQVGTYISANYSEREEPRNGIVDAFLCTLAQAPTAMPWLPDDGSGIKKYTLAAYPEIESGNKNMLAMIDYDIMARHKTYDMNGQIFFNLTPFKGFTWHTKMAGRLSDDKLHDWSGEKVPLYNYHSKEFSRNMDLGGGFIPGLQVEDDQNLYLNFYTYMEYVFQLKEDHNFKLMLGYNQEKNERNVIWAKRRDYQFVLPELDAGSNENMENSGYKEEWAIRSGFFRLNYDYKGKYMVEVNTRLDGTSRIASESRWGWFPSFSLGYRLTEEDFIKNLNWNWLSNLKIRGSWGQLRNQNIGLYPYQAIVDLTDSYPFDNATLTQGVAQKKYINRDLKWETTTITDVGLEISLFNRLNLTVDWYKKQTTDILRTAQLSNFVGLEAPYVNDGEMQNTGIEIAVNWNDYVKSGAMEGLQYNLGFYIDRYRNELTHFGADEIKSFSILREGIPYNSYYMLEAIGIFADQAEIDAAPKQFSDNTRPGDIRYRDVDNNGIIDYNDRVVMGGRFPKFEYSFNAGLSWKGFDLSLMFQGVEGKYTYVGASAGVVPFASYCGIPKDYLDGMWTEDNPENAINPRLYYDMGGTRNTRASSYYLRNASYLRLKNLMLGYTFPSEWTKKFAVNRLKVFFSGDNLLTFTPYKGLDPENDRDGSFLAYPQNRILSLGVNVEF